VLCSRSWSGIQAFCVPLKFCFCRFFAFFGWVPSFFDYKCLLFLVHKICVFIARLVIVVPKQENCFYLNINEYSILFGLFRSLFWWFKERNIKNFLSPFYYRWLKIVLFVWTLCIFRIFGTLTIFIRAHGRIPCFVLPADSVAYKSSQIDYHKKTKHHLRLWEKQPQYHYLVFMPFLDTLYDSGLFPRFGTYRVSFEHVNFMQLTLPRASVTESNSDAEFNGEQNSRKKI
jgi:hypothetical protein